jgi:predicted dehydrogenase
VVGAGYFSQFHLNAWGECGADVVAVCDSSLDRATAAAKEAGFERASTFDNVDAMLDAVDIDVLDIVVPPTFQPDVMKRVVASGIPAICQKPFMTSYAQATHWVDLVRDAGQSLIIHENFRFMPWHREARRLVEQGKIGRLHQVLFRLRPGDGQGPQAYLSRQPYFQTMPRFLVVETAIHFIDTFRFLMGEVVAVFAHLRKLNPVIAGEDSGVVVFEFENGSIGILDANRLNDHQADNQRLTMGEMWLEGNAGCLRLDGNAKLYWKPHGETERPHAYNRGYASARHYGAGACVNLQRSALAAMRGEGDFENSAQDYLRNILIQEAIYASHSSRTRIEIDSFRPPATPLVPQLAVC